MIDTPAASAIVRFMLSARRWVSVSRLRVQIGALSEPHRVTRLL